MTTPDVAVPAALEFVDCPACRSGRSRHLFWVRDYTYAVTDERFGVRRCRECGCGFLSPRPTESAISAYYPEFFYHAYEAGERLDGECLLATRRAQLDAKCALLGGMRPGRLLDIGAMKGEFVHVMRGAGWDAAGVEFSRLPPNIFDVPMHYGDFLALDLPPESFDCITMWAVLEHVSRPRDYVARIASLLKPGGRFLALVTNFDSLQARVLRADDYPRHLTLFTRRALRALTEAHDLRIRRIWTDQRIFRGSLYGGLVYQVKRLGGYSETEARREWRGSRDPLAFCCKWRGEPSGALRWVSRLDRALSWAPERMLDRAGRGFLLTFDARKAR